MNEVTIIKGSDIPPPPGKPRIIRPSRNLLWKNYLLYMLVFIIFTATLMIIFAFFGYWLGSELAEPQRNVLNQAFLWMSVIYMVIWFGITVFYIVGMRLYVKSMLFIVHGHEIVVHKGIINKSEKHVPYRTVTNINMKTGPFDRLFGIGTIEIKSGYGLSVAEELKTLRVVKKMQETSAINIIPTYLVHTIPSGYERGDYIRLVINKVLPEVAQQKLAVFCDIFCDKLAFTRRESKKILMKAREYGFKLKVHADQFSNIGGAHLAAKLRCVSADHLEYTTKKGILTLKRAGVIPTLLPGVTFFLQMSKKPDIHGFKTTHTPVAIASDFNHGSCTIYAMPKIIGFACLLYGMQVEDALLGATKYGAKALGMYDKIGSIESGKQADLVICDVDNYKKIPYYFGEDIVKFTIKKGRVIYGKNC